LLSALGSTDSVADRSALFIGFARLALLLVPLS
jgi:hypothetical protein